MAVFGTDDQPIQVTFRLPAPKGSIQVIGEGRQIDSIGEWSDRFGGYQVDLYRLPAAVPKPSP